MAMTTKMMLVAIVFYGLIFAAVVAVIVWAVKNLIRYGIDYYFKKLAESRFTENNKIILSALQPETLAGRFNGNATEVYDDTKE